MRHLEEIISSNANAYIREVLERGARPASWMNHRPFFQIMKDITEAKDFEPEEDAPEQCWICGSMEKTVLGRLGNKRYSRCRACGMEYYAPVINGVVNTIHEDIVEE